MGGWSVDDLVARARQDIAPGDNRFLDLLEAGAAPRETLMRLAGEEYRIVGSDRRSFALLAARFPEPPAGDLFLGLAGGEGQALRLLLDFAASLGWNGKDLREYDPHPLAQAYPAFVAQRAAFGGCSEVALAMLVNLDEWGTYCARAAAALRDRYAFDDKGVGFFQFFAEAPPGFAEQASAVIEAGLAAGEDPEEAVRAARMLHAYETAFWDSLAEGLG